MDFNHRREKLIINRHVDFVQVNCCLQLKEMNSTDMVKKTWQSLVL
jgi:hypothetical protein